jgi:hypothetical protein
MAKPLPVQNTFAGSAPPWSLTNLDANFTNVWGAVNDIGTYSNTLQDTGSVNALIATPPAGITFTLVTGISLQVIVANKTTVTNPTLNVGGTGAKTIVDVNGAPLSLGALAAAGIYQFIYNGTNWVCQGDLAVGAAQTAFKAATTSRNTATLTNDPDLIVSLSANATYAFEVNAYCWETAQNNQGLSWNINYSGSFSVGFVTMWSILVPTISGAIAISATVNNGVFGVGSSLGTNGTNLILHKGSILTTTAGVLGFAWANNAAGITNVGVSSWMIVTRVG